MNNSKFGEKVKILRQEKGWSQEELAEKLNVSRQAVYKWESNKGYPDIKNLIEISNIFEVTIDELIKGDADFQEEFTDDKDSFDQFSDPGFYLGMGLFAISIFTDLDSISTILMFAGLFLMVFYKETLKFLKVIVSDFKKVFKD